jgi:elongator complex protein 3
VADPQEWLEKRRYSAEQLRSARLVLEQIRQGLDVQHAMRRHPQPGGGYLPKHILVAVYKQLVASGEWAPDPGLLGQIRMKPVRTLSGVTTVTVLTEEYPCPGECIFCPTEARMPKSYLSDEPGARRALQNNFDPFAQVSNRLKALEDVGHPTDKVELLILGGTWSVYPQRYQVGFMQGCFEALNESQRRPPGEDGMNLEYLHALHLQNEDAAHRNVGLVVETRPDEITPRELSWLRQLGVTKLQMGAQSLDDRILKLNRRGHTSAQTLRACALLRAAGFKIVLHWMPNLLGATLESDKADFARLWQGYCPDEIKIYPTQLLENSALYRTWQAGEYQPYTTAELVRLIADIKPLIPPYCRVNRVIRDIPSTHVIEGNRRTSLRMDALAELERRGQACRCVRCREVREQVVDAGSLRLEDIVYTPADAEEHFLSFVTPQDKLAGYLRLSLPQDARCLAKEMPDLDGAALVREVHVYGQSVPVGGEQRGAAQHVGLGTRLLQLAEERARAAGFRRLAVIAAIGTRKYYQARGFRRGELYMYRELE